MKRTKITPVEPHVTEEAMKRRDDLTASRKAEREAKAAAERDVQAGAEAIDRALNVGKTE